MAKKSPTKTKSGSGKRGRPRKSSGSPRKSDKGHKSSASLTKKSTHDLVLMAADIGVKVPKAHDRMALIRQIYNRRNTLKKLNGGDYDDNASNYMMVGGGVESSISSFANLARGAASTADNLASVTKSAQSVTKSAQSVSGGCNLYK